MTMNESYRTSHEARLEVLAGGAEICQVLELYDSLPPATVEDMIGEWRGHGLPTGHPFDGLLERFGWYGKRFGGPEDVDPLLFTDRSGGKFALNPAMLPIDTIVAHPEVARNDVAGGLFKIGGKVLATNKPQARLRMTEYRGVVSATMIYDRLAINDVFRMVSNDILLGAMDIRGSKQPFMFVLKRA